MLPSINKVYYYYYYYFIYYYYYYYYYYHHYHYCYEQTFAESYLEATLIAEPFFCLLDFGVPDRLCMNRVKSLLSMRCILPGCSLEPKPNMPDLAAILVFMVQRAQL